MVMAIMKGDGQCRRSGATRADKFIIAGSRLLRHLHQPLAHFRRPPTLLGDAYPVPSWKLWQDGRGSRRLGD